MKSWDLKWNEIEEESRKRKDESVGEKLCYLLQRNWKAVKAPNLSHGRFHLLPSLLYLCIYLCRDSKEGKGKGNSKDKIEIAKMNGKQHHTAFRTYFRTSFWTLRSFLFLFFFIYFFLCIFFFITTPLVNRFFHFFCWVFDYFF